jgi:FdhD protein
MTEETNELGMGNVAPEIMCDRFSDEGWVRKPVHVPGEMEFAIYVNSKELVSILCTPVKLNCLVLGFLYNDGIISSVDDVVGMRVCEDDALADVKIKNTDFKLPTVRTLTSGCGGGVTFKTGVQKVESNIVISPQVVFNLMKQFQERMGLYRFCGGVHTSALANPESILIVSEDIGRHNTLDKIQGECMLRKLSAENGILISTGRVSSEMLIKAAKMRCPVIISRTSATERSISIAREMGITLIGYARGGHLFVYSHPERLGCSV